MIILKNLLSKISRAVFRTSVKKTSASKPRESKHRVDSPTTDTTLMGTTDRIVLVDARIPCSTTRVLLLHVKPIGQFAAMCNLSSSWLHAHGSWTLWACSEFDLGKWKWGVNSFGCVFDKRLVMKGGLVNDIVYIL